MKFSISRFDPDQDARPYMRDYEIEPKSGSYPVAGSQVGGLNGVRVGTILSLT